MCYILGYIQTCQYLFSNRDIDEGGTFESVATVVVDPDMPTAVAGYCRPDMPISAVTEACRSRRSRIMSALAAGSSQTIGSFRQSRPIVSLNRDDAVQAIRR